MQLTGEMLDKRICDCEPNSNNTETYREFIQESEKEFELAPANLDEFSDQKLTNYLEFMDYLWTK